MADRNSTEPPLRITFFYLLRNFALATAITALLLLVLIGALDVLHVNWRLLWANPNGRPE